MIAKPKQSKRLYWYMVLAIIVLLALFSRTNTMDSKTIVAGFSASQHAVNRRLRSHAEATENIDGDNEDRASTKFPIGNFKAERMDLKKATTQRKLLRSAQFKAWAKKIDDDHVGDLFKAEWIKMEEMRSHYKEETIRSLIQATKPFPGYKTIRNNLEIGFILKLLVERRTDDAFEMLKATNNDVSKSPLVTAWINYPSDKQGELYELVVNMLAEHMIKSGLAKRYSTKKHHHSEKSFEDKLLEAWKKAEYSGFDVFQRLKLNTAGMQSPLWETWVSYLTKLEKDRSPGAAQADDATLVFSALRDNLSGADMKNLIDTGKDVEETKKFAEQLKRKLQPFLMLGNS